MDSNIRFPVAEIVIEGSSANSSLRQSVTRRRRKYAQRGRFAPDSLLEGDGFEPSVPRRIFLAAPSILPIHRGDINRLPRERDRCSNPSPSTATRSTTASSRMRQSVRRSSRLEAEILLLQGAYRRWMAQHGRSSVGLSEPLPENGAKPGFSRRFAMRRA